MGFDVQARFFVSVSSLSALREACEYSRQHKLPILLLGGGSNIILTKDFDGLAIYLNLQGKQLIDAGQQRQLHVQAGENWHQLVQWSLQQQAYGLENLSLIPGNTGAAPIQNIGAYGVELVDVFDSLQALHLPTGELHTFSRDDCSFAYRDSVFKGKHKDEYAITQVNLSLSKNPQLKTEYGALQPLLDQQQQTITAQVLSDVICDVRRSKLPNPAQIGNAGSFFKNPIISKANADKLKRAYPHCPIYPVSENQSKVAAGWLIEQAGFKGCERGGVGVHDKQALVLVNRGDGTGEQLIQLAQEIQTTIQQQFQIQLEIEPRVY